MIVPSDSSDDSVSVVHTGSSKASVSDVEVLSHSVYSTTSFLQAVNNKRIDNTANNSILFFIIISPLH